jgi:hypothetical protein
MAITAHQTISEMEQKYYDVVSILDSAEELAATVDNTFIRDHAVQMKLVSPLIDAVTDSADMLTEEYIALLDGKKKAGAQKRIEGALRKIYVAMNDYSLRAAVVTQNAVGNIRNLADPVVEKLKHRMETIVAHFMEFISLSLDRVMQKHDIDELKQRHERIALMLHSQSMGQAT